MSPAAMIKTSATLYATLTGKERRGVEITKKDEGIESLVLSAVCVVQLQERKNESHQKRGLG